MVLVGATLVVARAIVVALATTMARAITMALAITIAWATTRVARTVLLSLAHSWHCHYVRITLTITPFFPLAYIMK